MADYEDLPCRALALFGWYLMVPPVGGDASAPRSHWRTIDSFDTAQECRRIERLMAGASPPTIRRLTVASPDKVREMAERGGALHNLESKQMLEYGVQSGRGGVTLNLTEEQLAKLKAGW